MPDQPALKKAQILEVDTDFKNVINKERAVEVQFNPETLKVAFSNQVTEKAGATDSKTKQPRQFISSGSTKLTLQLWFDVSVMGDPKTTDVRELTKKVVYFLTPAAKNGNVVPPSVRFLWGTFQFDGIMDSIEESLEFFSPDGRPLRASVSIAMSRQEITLNIAPGGNKGAAGRPSTGPNAAAPGTKPMTPAPAGSTLQGLAGSVGGGVSWQAVASANGVENPRLLAPGMMLDLNVSASASVSADAGVSASASLDFGG